MPGPPQQYRLSQLRAEVDGRFLPGCIEESRWKVYFRGSETQAVAHQIEFIYEHELA